MFDQKMSRRDFFRLSAVTSSGVLLASCGSWFSAGKEAPQPEEYYLAKREKILKDIDGTLKYIQQTCAEKYGAELANTLVTDARNRFDSMLSGLPYIGGDENGLTVNLYQGAASLAFYREMQNHQKTVEETGEILYYAISRLVRSDPLSGMDGRVSASEMAQSKFREAARQSQKKTYPEDWVFEFVEGDGASFDYGVDYLECGICKYFKKQAAEELTPYLCLMDFPVSGAQNTGLVRTSTLAHGARCCDFRYKTGRPCQMEWTPDFLKK
jgi:hypothetical protein